MNRIRLTFPDGTALESARPVPGKDCLERLSRTPRGNPIALKVAGELRSVAMPVTGTTRVEGVFADTGEGAAVYRRSLCFVLAAAAHNLFPARRLVVGHSLEHGYYYTVEGGEPVSDADIRSLKQEMERIVKADEPITTRIISYEEALKLFEKLGLTETRAQFNYINPAFVRINMLDAFADIYFGPLVWKTGALGVFDLMPYDDGFLLRFPRSGDPTRLTPFENQPKLFRVYKEYKMWGRRLGVTSAACINRLICDGGINDFIDVSETLQAKRISEIADMIHERPAVKLVLIAGPSSSGKTTVSKRLALELRALGYTPKTLALDDYYIGRAVTPKDENGAYDYESLEALNIELLNQNLSDLLRGREIKVPSYDFLEGVSRFEGNVMSLGKDDILIMEGIHGLNDKLTPLVAPENKFKIYASALTQLNLDDHNRISTSDNRLVRRIVRDAKYRAKDAAGTIAMWDSVRRGERRYIFPFQNNADAILNTALDYELPVLKVYAESLLRRVSPLQKEYSEASRLLKFLSYFSAMPAYSVPRQSIIREFIGGSAFRY